MKRSLVAAVSAAALLLASASAASASPVTPTFTATPTAPKTVAFDASATVCPWGFCSYTWTYFTATTNRLGVQMGLDPKITYAFPALGYYTVVLKVGVRCSPRGVSSCPGTTQQTVTVAY
jgi:opacity protein-like surface antigen